MVLCTHMMHWFTLEKLRAVTASSVVVPIAFDIDIGSVIIFSDFREACIAKLPCPIAQLPDSRLLHGWIPKNPHVVELKAILCGLPNLAHTHFVPINFTNSNKLHLKFSLMGHVCIRLKPDQRIATWGVVMWHNHSFHTIAEGGVPGYHQTSLRGENLGGNSSIEFCGTAGCSDSTLDWQSNSLRFLETGLLSDTILEK